MPPIPRIESLLAARLFVAPRLAGDRMFFVSNMSGHLSLYAMDVAGGVPEPLLPPGVALQNPTLLEGLLYEVFPDLDQIVVMIDRDGDERYQPMVVPIQGGYPEPLFGDKFANSRTSLLKTKRSDNTAHLLRGHADEQMYSSYRVHLAEPSLVPLGASRYGGFPIAETADHRLTVLVDAYGLGDHVGYLLNESGERRRLFGVPLDERDPREVVKPNSIGDAWFVDSDRALLFVTSLFDDQYGLGTLHLNGDGEPERVSVTGASHTGSGELEDIEHLQGNRFAVRYNIDGAHWVYEGEYNHNERTMTLDAVLVGEGPLSGGVIKGRHYDDRTGTHVFSFTTATQPTQIYTIDTSTRAAGKGELRIRAHTRERVLGIAEELLAPGEDASFTSYDGLRVSARLYLPSDALGYKGARPLVYYIHGGPQSQEHPDFAWFSMPLIQLLALRGFAVFVPNARGSTGYGFEYMNRVVRDWGGADRLDHVHAMTDVIPRDARIDVSRAGVVGRSYGGFMTLTLAARHPQLWSGAVDMFGPYDLLGFGERIPETWKPFMKFLLGDPEEDRDFLVERSPKTYLSGIECPLLVIQGKNDPRVVESESAALVEELRRAGKQVEYLMFENEGHDVLKFENRVRCYNAIVDFFERTLTTG